MSLQQPIRLMREGQGNITFADLGGGGGAPPGFINVAGARNGASVDADSFIVLGQEVGAAGGPAKLLDNRELPLNGKELQFPIVGDAFMHFTDGNFFMEYHRGTAGLTNNIQCIQFSTIQGLSPAPGAPFGNFQIMMDESFVNPDGQRDAAIAFGYNYNGSGGRINASEAAFSTVLESHFIQVDPAGQFEWYLQSIAKDGSANRTIFVVVGKSNGATQLDFTADTITCQNTVAEGNIVFGRWDNAGLILTGGAKEFQIQPDNPTDGTFTVAIQPGTNGTVAFGNGATGGQPLFTFDSALEWSTSYLVAGTTNFKFTSNSPSGPTQAFLITQGSIPFDLFTVYNNGTSGAFRLVVGFVQPTAGAYIDITQFSDGTAGTAPLKLPPGATLLTAPEDGCFEYDSAAGVLYFTVLGVRKTVTLV